MPGLANPLEDDNTPMVDPVATAAAGVVPPPVTPTNAPWLGTQPQIADTVAGHLEDITGQDSGLNRLARTQGLQLANRRGLLNSSMAVGAAQDAVLENALPIASQDAAQAFQKNMAAKGFEYGMTGQESQQTWQSGENIAQRGWQTAERLGSQGFIRDQAHLDRLLQDMLQHNQIDSDMALLVKQIGSTEGMERARLALQEKLFEADIAFRMSEGNLDRAAAVAAQQADINFQTAQNALTRDLQQDIAEMNLSATQQAGASDAVSSANTMFQAMYNSIMSNPDMSATDRASQLTSATNLRNSMLQMVNQMYGITLTW